MYYQRSDAGNEVKAAGPPRWLLMVACILGMVMCAGYAVHYFQTHRAFAAEGASAVATVVSAELRRCGFSERCGKYQTQTGVAVLSFRDGDGVVRSVETRIDDCSARSYRVGAQRRIAYLASDPDTTRLRDLDAVKRDLQIAQAAFTLGALVLAAMAAWFALTLGDGRN